MKVSFFARQLERTNFFYPLVDPSYTKWENRIFPLLDPRNPVHFYLLLSRFLSNNETFTPTVVGNVQWGREVNLKFFEFAPFFQALPGNIASPEARCGANYISDLFHKPTYDFLKGVDVNRPIVRSDWVYTNPLVTEGIPDYRTFRTNLFELMDRAQGARRLVYFSLFAHLWSSKTPLDVLNGAKFTHSPLPIVYEMLKSREDSECGDQEFFKKYRPFSVGVFAPLLSTNFNSDVITLRVIPHNTVGTWDGEQFVSNVAVSVNSYYQSLVLWETVNNYSEGQNRFSVKSTVSFTEPERPRDNYNYNPPPSTPIANAYVSLVFPAPLLRPVGRAIDLVYPSLSHLEGVSNSLAFGISSSYPDRVEEKGFNKRVSWVGGGGENQELNYVRPLLVEDYGLSGTYQFYTQKQLERLYPTLEDQNQFCGSMKGIRFTLPKELGGSK